MLECGYTCHAKCQMKAPQDCTGVNLKAEAKKAKKKKKGGEDDADSVNGNGSLRRTSTSSSITPSVNTPTSPASPARTTSISIPRQQQIPIRHIAAAPP